jgi:hypothetical protein
VASSALWQPTALTRYLSKSTDHPLAADGVDFGGIYRDNELRTNAGMRATGLTCLDSRCTTLLCECLDTRGYPRDMASRCTRSTLFRVETGRPWHTFRKWAQFFGVTVVFLCSSFVRSFGCNKNDTIQSCMMRSSAVNTSQLESRNEKLLASCSRVVLRAQGSILPSRLEPSQFYSGWGYALET